MKKRKRKGRVKIKRLIRKKMGRRKKKRME